MKLLLFDIDGTLLNGFGAGRQAVESAFQDVVGRSVDSDGLPFSGKTDLQIARELLVHAGVGADGDGAGRDTHAATAERLLDRYADLLEDTLPDGRVEALPGVPALLAHLGRREDVHLALLTGNLERTAYLKLDAAGLGGIFAFGAFGSDEADRNRLVPVATRRAAEHLGHAFSGGDVVVIGDTPRDVDCGAAHDAVTVGVCTGRFDRPTLEEAGAHHVFDDLTDAEHFAAAVLGDA